MSIYALKGRFQDILRPAVGALAGAGITANQVTIKALIFSVVVAIIVYMEGPEYPTVYLLLPSWMLVRMAFNAIDGMLAREFDQQSQLGAYLNELSDVVADAALYLSLLSVAGVNTTVVWLFVLTSALTEYTGALGLMVGASRRYDGPMGKSDRAVVIGLLGLALAFGWINGQWVGIVLAFAASLCVLTVLRRVKAGLDENKGAGA